MQIAIFQNMRAVIRAEHICRMHGISVAIMPVPEEVSSECGMCLRLNDEKEIFMELMLREKIEVYIYDKI